MVYGYQFNDPATPRTRVSFISSQGDQAYLFPTNDNVVEEFIELRNTGASTAPLYDPAYPANGWHLRNAVDFAFNASHSIPPGGNLLVVSFDPATDPAALAQFQSRYGSNLFLVG